MNARPVLFVAACCILAMQAAAIDASDRYRSPRNPERAIRRSTSLIVLHTTEAPSRSSLNKLSDRGEAHFCVTEEGSVYRIVDRDREAFHAGRSMWNGREDVDKFSIGIECVGYHDKPMPLVQVNAIRQLVKELQSMYGLPDACVVAHSHVAYGAPNRWHRKRHRGRKQCGMLFATPTMRRMLGLSARPAADPDIRAGRLVSADDYLRRVLYGRLDIMARHYPAFAPKPVPNPRPMVMPAPAPKPKSPAKSVAASAAKRPPASIADLRARGFVSKGAITREVTAMKLVGTRWNAPDTYYTIRDKVIAGNEINPARIENGMNVWIRP